MIEGLGRVRKIAQLKQKEEHPFDQYLGSDLALLVVLLSIEFAKDDKKVVVFSEFLKFFRNHGVFNLDKFEELSDYMNVVEFIIYVFPELKFINIDKLYFDEDTCVKNILGFLVGNVGSPSDRGRKDIVDYFNSILNSYFRIKQRVPELKIEYDRFEYYDVEGFSNCFEVELDQVKNEISDLLLFASDSVALGFSLNKEKACSFEKLFNDYFVKSFREFYGKDDLVFIEQELADFKFINGAVRIPCELFTSEDFDIIAILKYLDVTKQISVKEWNVSAKFWEAKLLTKDLLSIFVPNPDAFLQIDGSDKISMCLNSKSRVVIVNDIIVDLKKADNQFDLLTALLKEKPIDFDLSFFEIAEIVDHSYVDLSDESQIKQCKRYSNAAFQVSKKIGLESGIKDVLVLSKNGVRFSPKYKFRLSSK